MSAYTVLFQTGGQSMSREIEADTPEQALDITRGLWDDRRGKPPIRFIDVGYAVLALKPVPPIRVAHRYRKSYGVVAVCQPVEQKAKGGAA